MAGCDNNCEAVAGLHESAVNLIQYEKLIQSWLYGGADQTVDVGGVLTPTLLNLAMSIKQLVGVWPDNLTIKISPDKKIYVPLDPNGGVRVGANGLYTDFSDLPKEKLDEILQSLRLPIWLTGYTNFYVDKNHAAASDTLDEGRGLTASKPFKTIQAAVNYVCDNFNFGKYDATIHIAPGTYPESVTLGSYTSTTGVLNLVGHDTGTGELDTVITTTNNKGVKAIAAKSYRVRNIKFDYTVNGSIEKFEHCIGAVDGAALYLDRFHMNATYAAGVDSSTFNRLIYSYNRGLVFIQNTSAGSSKITINNGGSWLENVIRVENNGTFQMGGAGAASSQYIICSGVFNRFIVVDAATALRYTIYPYNMAFFGTNVFGARYGIYNGGHCAMSGGPDFFPGTEAGIVDATTYSWYI